MVARDKLSEMNPFINVTILQKTINIHGFEDNSECVLNENYSAIVYGFRNFSEAFKLNQIARKNNGIPFYCLNSSGLFGFFYADLGPELIFRYTNPKL